MSRSIVLIVIVAVVCMVAGVDAAVRMRGQFDYSQQQAVQPQQQQQSQPQGDLISFLQSHQRAFAAQSNGQSVATAAPSEQAQQAAQQTIPAGANEVTGDNVLSALEHTPHALVQTGSKSGASVAAGHHVAGPGEDGDGEDFGPCKTCVFVLERIKKGSNMLLPAICSELYHKYPDAYALCHQVLNALSINGNNVRYWLFEGCFKYEIYQSKEWIKPCPSHVMCSVLKDLSAEPFCPALPMENPFADKEE
jgi:hypothetical protein